MEASPLAVDRVEFLKVQIASVQSWKSKADQALPQLSLDMSNSVFEWRASLDYGDDELLDPRHFVFHFGLRLQQDSQKKKVQLPYEIEVEVVVFLRFEADELPPPQDRFKLIRANGYPIAYAAIREMVCSYTGRSSHGVWQLPSVNFMKDAEAEAVVDEHDRITRLAAQKRKASKVKSRKAKAIEHAN